MSLLAAINGGIPASGSRRSAKPSDGDTTTVGSTPDSSAELFERTLSRFEFVLARLIPVRRFTGGADPRLADCALSRLPFMEAAITFITLFLERDHAHDVKHIPDNNILSRCILCLTDIYLSSNIFLR